MKRAQGILRVDSRVKRFAGEQWTRKLLVIGENEILAAP
jgi:hypothetical protein